MNLTAARGGESDWQLRDFIINWKWYEHALDSIDVWGLGVEKVEDRSLLRTSQPYQNANIIVEEASTIESYIVEDFLPV